MFKGIVTSDWHLRKDRPRCRIDENWINTQEDALNQVADICIKYNCDLFLVGDIFHRASEFEMVIYIQKLAQKLKKYGLSVYYLCGNHDMLYHSTLNLDKSAIGLLRNSENCFFIKGYFDKLHFNSGEKTLFSASNFDEQDYENAEIVFKHVLTIPQEDKPDFVDCETPESLLKKFPNSNLIFTGDYHHNFHYEKKGRHVVNSGCLLRQASDMKNYQCGVYFVDTDENIVEFIPIIDNEDLIDDSYILQENERNERIESFVDKLKKTKGVSLDFIENVQNEMKHNKFETELVQVVDELLEV